MIATARTHAGKLEALAKTAQDKLRIARVGNADADGVAELRETLAGEKLDLLFVVAGISGSVPCFSQRKPRSNRRAWSLRQKPQAQGARL